jgi:hypothetical protein
MTKNKKWFFSLIPLSHKEYVTFEDNKKGKVLGISIIKVNDCFTLNDVALVDRLGYNLFSVSQFCDVDLSVLFCKSDSHILDSSDKRVCVISHIGNIFQSLCRSEPGLSSVRRLPDRDFLPTPSCSRPLWICFCSGRAVGTSCITTFVLQCWW